MKLKLCRGVIRRALLSEKVFRILFSLTSSQSKRSDFPPTLLLSPACTIIQDSFVVVEIECYFKCRLVGLLVSKRCFRGKTKVFFQYPFCLALSVIKAKTFSENSWSLSSSLLFTQQMFCNYWILFSPFPTHLQLRKGRFVGML